MAVSHIGADDEENVGRFEVLIRPGWPVRAEGQLVTRTGAGHAQPRVRLDLVGADEPFGQLVGQVLGLERHLSGHIQGEGIRPVFVDDLP